MGLCCCAQAFSSCGERGLLFVVVRGLLIAVASRCRARALGVRASVVVAHRLSSCGSRALERRLSSCGAWASLLCGMWDLPVPGLEPASPALAGGAEPLCHQGSPVSWFLILLALPYGASLIGITFSRNKMINGFIYFVSKCYISIYTKIAPQKWVEISAFFVLDSQDGKTFQKLSWFFFS